MSRLALNKSSMIQETRKLHVYEEFLPSLDMKRRQLMIERNRARKTLEQEQTRQRQPQNRIAEQLTMLALPGIKLSDIVAVKGVEMGEELILSARLPTLEKVRFKVRPYAFLVTPHWLEFLVEMLKKAMTLHIAMAVYKARLETLDEAVRTISQRVNLFEKVLIPQTRENIRRIRIYLSDADRAAVVRAKIAKRKRGRP